jgi:anti-anti-sigma factor
MVAIGSSCFVVPDRHPVLGEPGPQLVVWLRGRHDASTESALCMTLARAIAVGGPGLVLDLAEVEAMSTSALAVIARAREYLRQRSASLTVRSPTAPGPYDLHPSQPASALRRAARTSAQAPA